MPLFYSLYTNENGVKDVPNLSYCETMTEEEEQWYRDSDRFRHFNNAYDGDELSRRYLLDKYEEMGIERRD